MADVDELFERYKREHLEGGEADPRRYLAELDGAERLELAALIDAYLERAKGRSWDPRGFAGSQAERFAAEIASEWEVEAESAIGWRELLPTLRSKTEVRRRDLVERLAEALGVGDRLEKVADYYHRMEIGELAASGVSDRVLAALASLLGTDVEALRRAGNVTAGQPTEGEARAQLSFARTAQPDPRYEDDVPGEGEAPGGGPSEDRSRGRADEVDELFTGGPDA